MSPPTFDLGTISPFDAPTHRSRVALPAHHFVSHAVAVGMTGSGKTGLVLVAIEEALRASVPVIAFDVKGDLPNLLLAFADGGHAPYVPWVDAHAARLEGRAVEAVAAEVASKRSTELAAWNLDDATRSFSSRAAIRLLTPGGTTGEPVHVLSTLERVSPLWAADEEAARATLGAAVSLVLRLLDRDPDPASSREHALMCVLAERRLRAGEACTLETLIADLTMPPIDIVGAMALDDFLKERERSRLAAALNVLLASPTFASWRQGAPLDVAAWIAPRDDGRTPAAIVSVAHLDDDERMLVVGMVLEEVLAWVRTQPGTSALCAMVVFDEAYGFVPPHPANPPSKRALVALMKQARGFGVGVVVATQNPMDLDYRALSNAGLWFIGRLQTDADRERVIEGLMTHDGFGWDREQLGDKLKRLAPRWFVLRDAHTPWGPVLLQTRPTLSWMRGPMTRGEVRRVADGGRRQQEGAKAGSGKKELGDGAVADAVAR